MTNKFVLLALGAVSAMMLTVPATASAIESLHLNPSPIGTKTIDGIGKVTLSTTSGSTTTCDGLHGTSTFESGGTTGKLILTFGPNCTTNLGGTCTNHGASSIITTELPFHLATVEHRNGGAASPGVLVTPGLNESFAHFTCHVGFLTLDTTVTGNGVIGTITTPPCNGAASEATISFAAASAGLQTDNKLKGTLTTYSLVKSSENLALQAHGRITFGGPLDHVCT